MYNVIYANLPIIYVCMYVCMYLSIYLSVFIPLPVSPTFWTKTECFYHLSHPLVDHGLCLIAPRGMVSF